MNNQKIIFSVLLAVGLLTWTITSYQLANGKNQPGCNSNGGSCGGTTPDTGPTITQKEINNPKTIHIPGQNKCQTLDGFSADEPCPSGSHHSKHHSSSNSDPVTTTSDPKPKKGTLQQIPSNDTDFANGDSNTLQLVFVHTSKSFGFWHIKGMVTNLSNDTVSFLNVIATIYDGNMNVIDTEQAPATISGNDNDIDHGISKPFDILFDGSNLGGAKPAFFKLGYQWQ